MASKIDIEQECLFCGRQRDDKQHGQLLHDKDKHLYAHHFCLLFSSGLAQGGDDREGIVGFLEDDIIKEYKRSKRLKCVYCKQKGASIGCSVPECKCTYHFVCGKENGVMYIYHGNFSSYCPEHRPVQAGLSKAEKKKSAKRDILKEHCTSTCYICYCEVPTEPSFDVILSPCCTRALYHRPCLEEMALSAGIHFFRCPFCNDAREWQEEMLKCGIYIPDRDASWELEPGAFNSLLERRIECDAEECLCPKGREYDDVEEHSGWEIIFCGTCGSQGVHISCSGMKRRVNKQWLCTLCKDVDHRLEAENKKATPAKTPKKRSQRKRQQVSTPGRPTKHNQQGITEVTNLMLNSSLLDGSD